MNTIRVFLVDDHYLLKLGLAALLKFQKDIRVVGDAENGRDAILRVAELKPDVVVMDLMMPVMDGVEATRQIKAALPTARILILTSFGTSMDVSRALAAGATGAILKDATEAELLNAIRQVADGKTVIADEIASQMTPESPPEFTDKQLSILESITRGLTDLDIAKQFDISADAVKQHLNAIRAKLGAANRTEAVAIALRKHLLKI